MEEQKQANTGVMDVSGAAEYLKFSRRKLYDLVRRGEIPHKKIGRQYRFTRRNLDEWLSGPTAAASVGADLQVGPPSREPTDEEMLGEVAATRNDSEKHLLFVALLTRALARRGKSCVVVGDQAVEFYTGCASGARIINLASSALEDINKRLRAWGFRAAGPGLAHDDMNLFVGAPADGLTEEEGRRVLRVEIHGLEVCLHGLEDVTRDCLNAYVQWNSEQDGFVAKTLLHLWWDQVDWDYLRRRCDRDEVREALDRLRGEVEKERRG